MLANAAKAKVFSQQTCRCREPSVHRGCESLATVVVASTVPAAVPSLPVQCTDLQTAARQAEQGAGGSHHVSGSGMVLTVLSDQ